MPMNEAPQENFLRTPLMGVQKERKSTFLTVFEHREKEARSLFAAQY